MWGYGIEAANKDFLWINLNAKLSLLSLKMNQTESLEWEFRVEYRSSNRDETVQINIWDYGLQKHT